MAPVGARVSTRKTPRRSPGALRWELLGGGQGVAFFGHQLPFDFLKLGRSAALLRQFIGTALGSVLKELGHLFLEALPHQGCGLVMLGSQPLHGLRGGKASTFPVKLALKLGPRSLLGLLIDASVPFLESVPCRLVFRFVKPQRDANVKSRVLPMFIE